MSGHHHGGGAVAAPAGLRRIALVGSPNTGKTTLFNALTGLSAKVGNYPGVTVSRYQGTTCVPGGEVLIEDLPGTYSLDPISPDEIVVANTLDADHHEAGAETPDALVVVLDATNLRRSLGLLAQVLRAELPTVAVLSFSDELARRGGSVDLPALEAAIGVPLLAVTGGDRAGITALRERLADIDSWQSPIVLPPTDPQEALGWADSVLSHGAFTPPRIDERTRRIDAVLLHPVWGTLIFFVTMFAFFQMIFTVAAPLQDGVGAFFGWLGGIAADHISNPTIASFVSDGLIGGVGSVLVFLPQIALLFVMIALLEGTGYMSRAAFLMDRVMSFAGLEGRAFVSLLSSVACAIPGIMATRSLPSARDRLATMMAAPMMTCSARLPVYVLLISMLVPSSARFGPFGAQGAIMFGLYLLGALSAMTSAWVFSKIASRRVTPMPFYMEMPSYRLPKAKYVALTVWEACMTFVKKVARIILVVTLVLWVLLNLPNPGQATMQRAGVDTSNNVAVSQYQLDHSYAASIGRAVEPVFRLQGFDWRINIGIVSSLAAREVYVATLGQVAAAENPDDPGNALQKMTVTSGPRAGEKLFTPPVIAAILVFFVYALQCVSTIAALRRESGSWRWPAIAFGYMFVLAWTMSLLAHTLVGAFWP